MDTIAFSVTTHGSDDPAVAKRFSVKVLLNGNYLQHNDVFNIVEVMILAEAEVTDFDLFTCTCGAPGCAGYHTQIHHLMKADKVIWDIPSEYKLEKRFYEFEIAGFKDAINSLRETVVGLFKQGFICEMMGDTEEDLNDTINWLKKYSTSSTTFYKVLAEVFGEDYREKTFEISYKGEVTRTKIPLGQFVAEMTNEYPNDLVEDQDEFAEVTEYSANVLKQAFQENDFSVVYDMLLNVEDQFEGAVNHSVFMWIDNLDEPAKLEDLSFRIL